MKFRKKPVVIEAVQFTQGMLEAYLFDGGELVPGLRVTSTHLHPPSRKIFSFRAGIDTLEGFMQAEIGDWIIRGVKGEFYPCKPDIFAATYEDAAAPTLPDAQATTNEQDFRDKKADRDLQSQLMNIAFRAFDGQKPFSHRPAKETVRIITKAIAAFYEKRDRAALSAAAGDDRKPTPDIFAAVREAAAKGDHVAELPGGAIAFINHGTSEQDWINQPEDDQRGTNAEHEEMVRDAERYRWLVANMTFYNPGESDAPVLASVSKRVWYHATDDENYPISVGIDAAIAAASKGDGHE